MNFEKYPWLKDLSSSEAKDAIDEAKSKYKTNGAVIFPEFVTAEALQCMIHEARTKEDDAFTTDGTHTPYLLAVDDISYSPNSIRNFQMRTKVASIAYDELGTSDSDVVDDDGGSSSRTVQCCDSASTPNGGSNSSTVDNVSFSNSNNEKDENTNDKDGDPSTITTTISSSSPGDKKNGSMLAQVYQNPILTELVTLIAEQTKPLYLSADPIGCCTINVFREGYYHSFHFDESEFSTTLMLQQASDKESGLFQYTPLLRQHSSDLALPLVASTIQTYGSGGETPIPSDSFCDLLSNNKDDIPPKLHTLDFQPGTLSIFSGSRSLHRVTKVKGSQSRLVAVLTYATVPNFQNSKQVQELFWGRHSYH